MNKEFRKLAESIANEKDSSEHFLCVELKPHSAEYLETYFKPTTKERLKYNMGTDAWLSELDSSDEITFKNNEFRILILLFAEQHYLTYYKS